MLFVTDNRESSAEILEVVRQISQAGLNKFFLVGNLQVSVLTERVQTAGSTLICTSLSSSPLWTLNTSLLTITAVGHQSSCSFPASCQTCKYADQFLQLVLPSAGPAGTFFRLDYKVKFKLCLKLTQLQLLANASIIFKHFFSLLWIKHCK